MGNDYNIGSPSPRKKRNNSTPVKKSATDKTLILQHLVKPRVNFSELISLTECRLPISSMDFDKELKETNLSETIESLTPTPLELAIDDPKLEKKVTFVRLLNKLSQEMSSSSEVKFCDAYLIILKLTKNRYLHCQTDVR